METTQTLIPIEIIIHLTIRDSSFTSVIAIAHHSTVNGNIAKKSRKKIDVKNILQNLTRIQLGFLHKNQTIEINICK